MQQHELRQAAGATHKRKRVGRGNASGHGTYSTRGMKGQKARAGGAVRPSFEGGQFPFVRRMAYKRGFTNPFRIDYEEVNIGDLAAFAAGADVTVEMLREARLVRTNRPVKILADGELNVALKVTADRFSKSARTKIEAAGGSIVWIGGEPIAKEDRPPTKKMLKVAAAAAAKAASASGKKQQEPSTETGEEA